MKFVFLRLNKPGKTIRSSQLTFCTSQAIKLSFSYPILIPKTVIQIKHFCVQKAARNRKDHVTLQYTVCVKFVQMISGDE